MQGRRRDGRWPGLDSSHGRSRAWTAATTATAAGVALLAAPAAAQDAPTPPAETPPGDAAPAETETDESETPDLDSAIEAVTAEEITVIGSVEAERKLPGAGTYLPGETIRRMGYDDVNRALRRVPGVTLREEDGFGLFPNISLRGVDTARSAKVTLMEDAILTAPAPYAAPEAYYIPTTARMHAIEVLKGSSQIRYGPHTTGGAINYVSTPIPDDWRGFAAVTYGSHDEARLHGWYGGTIDAGDAGRFGFLAEGFSRQNDGFKTIDRTPDFDDGDETGFTREELILKGAWDMPTRGWKSRLEVKWGQSKLDANETYLGLSEEDFDEDPYRRYSASRFDNMDTTQAQQHVRWLVSPNDDLDFALTSYYGSFERDWFKLNDIRDATGRRVSMSQALAEGGAALATLRGEAAGELRVRHNARTYYLGGTEAVGTWRFDAVGTAHELAAGFRLHEDRIRRYQQDENFTQAANGAITARDVGPEGGAGNAREKTTSVAWWVQDRIRVDRLSVTPGFRVEDLRLDNDNYDDPTVSGREDLRLDAFGIGAVWEQDDHWTLFGGRHEGFSPPSPNNLLADGVEDESSVGWEVGARFEDRPSAFGGSLTLFRTDFEDLIVVDNLGGTGTGESESVGEVRSQGVEASLSYDPGVHHEWGVGNPWWLAVTVNDAEQRSDSDSSNAESMFAGGTKGAEVPYIPDWQIAAGTGIVVDRFEVHVTGSWVPWTYTTASNTKDQVNTAGVPDARFGRTDSYFVVDLAVRYRVNENVTVVGGIQNVFDEEYIVSRHPHGPRPGAPLFAFVGMEIDF